MKLAILVTLLLGAGIAHADRSSESPHPRRAQLRQALVQQFDRDGDGRLEPRERKQAARTLRRLANRMQHGNQNGHRRERLIRRFDLNGDGNLGPGEVPPHVAKRLHRIDHNGDGWISGDELP